ncbi:MAG: hypothetical protein LBM78_02230 [Clostridiales bacterium]|jgi:hypothetical protein|nr:hypothetical protein [Clostridiales bacterium]
MCIQNIKKSIIARSLTKLKKKTPFDARAAEAYALPKNADTFTNNSYYFTAHAADGGVLIFRLGLRGGGLAEVWFLYRMPDGLVYAAVTERSQGAAPEAFVRCVQSETVWEFGFDGVAAVGAAQRRVKLTAEFAANTPIFEFSHHMDAAPVARALAAERWTKDFRAALKVNHQTHYEQGGTVSARITDGGAVYAIDGQAVRDHSFGHRDWSYMDRHYWLSALLDDGSVFNVNAVQYPALKGLQTGYRIKRDGRTVCVDTSDNLYRDVTQEGAPQRVTLYGTMTDGKPFALTATLVGSHKYVMDDGAYNLYEGYGTYDLNGLKGRGIIEFGFNGDRTRW